VGLARARGDRGSLARLLIVNADDFGRAKGVNLGIARAHREGIVTSTTLMTNAPGTAHAATLAATTPGLDIGVHLVLTYARPLLHPSRIRSLVREDGSFWRPSELLARSIDRREALMAYRAQFTRAPELVATSAYARERPIELAALTDPRVRAALESRGITLTTFSDL